MIKEGVLTETRKHKSTRTNKKTSFCTGGQGDKWKETNNKSYKARVVSYQAIV